MRLLPGKASGGSAGVYSARNSQVSTLCISSPLAPVSNVILPFSPNSNVHFSFIYSHPVSLEGPGETTLIWSLAINS